MTMLTVWRDDNPATASVQTSDRDVIAVHLRDVGVDYRHVTDLVELPAGAGQDEVIAAYRAFVDALSTEHGYTLVDVAQLHAVDDDESRAVAAGARQKFLAEHTHDEDEIRFFAQGSGVFYLHLDGRVMAMLCTEGGLISVPALTTHWFDMGTSPDFTAIRFFRTDDGWVGTFTGSDIATRFATYDELSAVAAQG